MLATRAHKRFVHRRVVLKTTKSANTVTTATARVWCSATPGDFVTVKSVCACQYLPQTTQKKVGQHSDDSNSTCLVLCHSRRLSDS